MTWEIRLRRNCRPLAAIFALILPAPSWPAVIAARPGVLQGAIGASIPAISPAGAATTRGVGGPSLTSPALFGLEAPNLTIGLPPIGAASASLPASPIQALPPARGVAAAAPSALAPLAGRDAVTGALAAEPGATGSPESSESARAEAGRMFENEIPRLADLPPTAFPGEAPRALLRERTGNLLRRAAGDLAGGLLALSAELRSVERPSMQDREASQRAQALVEAAARNAQDGLGKREQDTVSFLASLLKEALRISGGFQPAAAAMQRAAESLLAFSASERLTLGLLDWASSAIQQVPAASGLAETAGRFGGRAEHAIRRLLRNAGRLGARAECAVDHLPRTFRRLARHADDEIDKLVWRGERTVRRIARHADDEIDRLARRVRRFRWDTEVAARRLIKDITRRVAGR